MEGTGRRAPDRPVRQDPAARGRPSGPPVEARAAIAPFAELERAPERPHLPRHPAGPVERAGRRARRGAGRRRARRFSRYAVPQPLLVDVVDTMGRYGRLQLTQSAGPRPGARRAGSGRTRGDPAAASDRTDARRAHRRRHRHRARVRARSSQAGPPQDRLALEDLAGYVDGEAHPIELRERAGRCATTSARPSSGSPGGGSGVVVLLRRKVRRSWCGEVGESEGDHADPRDEHGRGATVETRTDRADHADRRRDRRILRGTQGDPARHDSHLSGDDAQVERRVPPSRPVRLSRLGIDRLRRGTFSRRRCSG